MPTIMRKVTIATNIGDTFPPDFEAITKQFSFGQDSMH
jgi:hypothetical protein